MNVSSSSNRLSILHRYWLATNYLAAGQIFLCDNPLLQQPLKAEHIKPRLLGHWGTSPGLNLVYVHLNRLICDTGSSFIFVTGPGHGAPAVLANVWLEGTYSEIYPQVGLDENGMRHLFRQFSTPGGVPSHASASTPGSIHEGGELGYSLAHAFGAAFDNPELIVACVVGDGEAETGPASGSWKSIDYLNPARDGAVLPILHLNGYKISGPTVFGRLDTEELRQLFAGYGYDPMFVAGDDPEKVHRAMISVLDKAYARIQDIQRRARSGGKHVRGQWPVVILQTPKGWTGPKKVDGKAVEGTFRAHQVPLPRAREDDTQRMQLEHWMKGYHPESLFDDAGRPDPAFSQLIPPAKLRMGSSPFANGGRLRIDMELPDFTSYGLAIPGPGRIRAEATRTLGNFLRDVMKMNAKQGIFRLFCPDETNSNRLGAVFEVTDRCTMLPIREGDDHLSPEGRVMEVLSEHLCQGWLEGYLLTGRHGVFPCYEAFVTIADSMVNQHAKWLKSAAELPWRKPISSLNYLLTSHAWRQDHNGYSHQGPGFIDTVINKKNTITRIYLPPDANTLLSVMDHCLRSRDYVNVVVAGKQPELQWLSMDEARQHCARGASIWSWAGNAGQEPPDIVFGCAGDVPTVEAIAAAWLLQRHVPQIRVQVVNVVDLMALSPPAYHPHGLDEESFLEMFTDKVPVVFAYHGYPRIIHDLVHGRPNPHRFHVRGYIEEGTTTTPFDMVVLNRLSRYHLACDAIGFIEKLDGDQTAQRAIDYFKKKLEEHSEYIVENLQDMPEVHDWFWSTPRAE